MHDVELMQIDECQQEGVQHLPHRLRLAHLPASLLHICKHVALAGILADEVDPILILKCGPLHGGGCKEGRTIRAQSWNSNATH